MKNYFGTLLLLIITMFVAQQAVHAQEGFAVFTDDEFGVSVSYPKIWTPKEPSGGMRLLVHKDVDFPDYISFQVWASKYKGVEKTTDEFVTNLSGNPGIFTKNFTDPKIIKNEKVKFASHNGVRLEIESTVSFEDLTYRTTFIIYATMVDGNYYSIGIHCRKAYFPQHKFVMEKVASSFSISPVKAKAKVESKSKVRSASDILNSEAIFLPPPRYSPAAKAIMVKGEVKVRIRVNNAGDVVDAIAGGHPLLTPSAVEAAKKARFNPKDEISAGILIYKFPPE